eukprot:symbB.v1.2.019194.t1/scaffold1512.1/size114451/5
MIFIPLTFSDEPAARLSRWLQGFGHAEWAGGALNPLNPSRDCMRLLHMTTGEKASRGCEKALVAPNERSDCYVTPMQHSCSSSCVPISQYPSCYFVAGICVHRHGASLPVAQCFNHDCEGRSPTIFQGCYSTTPGSWPPK